MKKAAAGFADRMSDLSADFYASVCRDNGGSGSLY